MIYRNKDVARSSNTSAIGYSVGLPLNFFMDVDAKVQSLGIHSQSKTLQVTIETYFLA